MQKLLIVRRLGAVGVVCSSLALGALGCGDSASSEDQLGESKHAVVQPQKLSISIPSGVDFKNVAVASNGTALYGDRSKLVTPSGGFAASAHGGASLVTLGFDTKIGPITSVGSVKLLDRAQVTGAVTTEGTVTYGQNPASVVVTGGISTQVPVSPLSVAQWTVPFDATTVDVTVSSGTRNLAPGGYRNVNVQNGTLVLRAGSYYLDNLTLEPNVNLTIDSSAGPVFLYIKSSLIFRANMTGAAEKLLLGYLGTQLVALERPFNGTIVAPNARVRLAVGNVAHSGAVLAKEVELDPGVTLTHRAFANWSQVTFNVVPRFECVETLADGSKAAVFGYSNANASSSTIALGAGNTFTPTPANRGQPTVFPGGSFQSLFTVPFTGSALRWTLSGTDAVVDGTKACAASAGLRAIADAEVVATAPRQNFGSTTSMRASSTEYSLVAFDRSALVAARGAGRFVRSARLEVSLNSGSGAVDAHLMRQAWNESSATWSCANDRDASATTEDCLNADRWEMPKRPGSWDNPYANESPVAGSASGPKVVFDVTEDVQRLLSTQTRGPVAWALQSKTGATTSVLGTREGGRAARLFITTAGASDLVLGGAPPFTVTVDTSIAQPGSLPPFPDGSARPLGVLRTSEGRDLRFVENELLVLTDSATELAAIKTRWGATEVAAPDRVLPGLQKAHVLRIDGNRANPASLVANLQQFVNRPDGVQRVSSASAIRTLAAAADERVRGTVVGINWLSPGADLTLQALAEENIQEGNPAPGTTEETSSNTLDWESFGPGMHDVNEAWKLLFFNKKLKRSVDVAIIDTGFTAGPKGSKQLGCASGECENPFNCGGGTPCKWHGTHVANAGFGEPNNQIGGAGPGAEVSDLTMLWGFGDMGTLLLTIPGLVLGGEDIINLSNAIPVPDYLFWSVEPAEWTLWSARKISGRLIFAASGNQDTDVDRRQCYFVLFGEICPWERETWFPCESDGVNCVGATNYADKNRAPYSNYGKSVRYYSTGTILTGADPETPIGTQFSARQGTSYASPFMAGTAALTWAANLSKGAGDVESCLNAAQVGGPSGRFVNTFFATACALGGQSSNIAPFVDITSPEGDTADFNNVGLISLVAQAVDFEGAPINSIFWSSNVEGNLGSSLPGQPFLYQPSGPGLRVITATANDPSTPSLQGRDTINLSFSPAPPNFKIISPAVGQDVILGLPTDLIASITNLPAFPGTQPCGSFVWTGFSGNSIVFDNLSGCSALGTYNSPGQSRARVSATLNGLQGSAERFFNVVSDGKLHAKITSPLRGSELRVNADNNAPLTLSATTNAAAGVNYSWTVKKVARNGTVETVGTIINGQNATYTPSYPKQVGSGCWTPGLIITVTAVDGLGRVADDTVVADVDVQCDPA